MVKSKVTQEKQPTSHNPPQKLTDNQCAAKIDFVIGVNEQKKFRIYGPKIYHCSITCSHWLYSIRIFGGKLSKN